MDTLEVEIEDIEAEKYFASAREEGRVDRPDLKQAFQSAKSPSRQPSKNALEKIDEEEQDEP